MGPFRKFPSAARVGLSQLVLVLMGIVVHPYPGWTQQPVELAGPAEPAELPHSVRADDDHCVERLWRNVEYARPGGHRLLADVYLPGSPSVSARPLVGRLKHVEVAGAEDVAAAAEDEAEGTSPRGRKLRPGLLLVHGGAWLGGSKEDMRGVARAALRRDYAAVAINYRLAPRFPFPAQIHDVHTALLWLRRHGPELGIDPTRLGLYGYSAGAQLACLLGAEQGGRDSGIRAVVAGGAPCEFSWIDRESRALAYWLGGSRSEVPDQYRRAAPVNFVSPDDPPIFFFHGERDRLVPVSSPQRMIDRLQGVGVRAELVTVPAKGHIMTFLDLPIRDQALDFLAQHLEDRTQPGGP